MTKKELVPKSKKKLPIIAPAPIKRKKKKNSSKKNTVVKQIRIKEDFELNLFRYLKKIYGISYSNIEKIQLETGINKETKLSILPSSELDRIKNYILTNLPNIGLQLKRKLKERQKFLSELKNLRSIREKLGLPVRGQRTHTNGKTKKKLSFFKK